MKNMFQAGELARLQKISKQTLLYYDKIGLFRPKYIDPKNGYRYYSADQLDYLDTILIMKKSGFTLEEIKKHMSGSTAKSSLVFMENQMDVIDAKMKEWSMIRSRLAHRCEELKEALLEAGEEPQILTMPETALLYYKVEEPYDMANISIATKKCYAQALTLNLPIYFECGVSVPFDHIKENRYTEANMAFVTSEILPDIENLKILPKGRAVGIWHLGNYDEIYISYKKILEFCKKQGLKIISDSYEFCVNDYMTSKDEKEFITKIIFYVQ